MKDSIENLYQKSKTDKSPVSLDNFILSQAKNSCDGKQAISHSSDKRRWLIRLSTAAVVVMSFSVILNLQNENKLMTQPAEYMQKSIQKTSVPIKQKQTSSIGSPNAVLNDAANTSDQEAAGVSAPLQTETVNRSFVKESTDDLVYPVPAAPIKEMKSELKQESRILTKKKMQAIEKYRIKSDEKTPLLESENLETVSGRVKSIESKDIPAVSVLKNIEVSNDSLDDITNNEEQDLDPYEGVDSMVIQDSDMSLIQQLEQLNDLIKKENLIDARTLLAQLQKIYSSYDFSKYEYLSD